MTVSFRGTKLVAERSSSYNRNRKLRFKIMPRLVFLDVSKAGAVECCEEPMQAGRHGANRFVVSAPPALTHSLSLSLALPHDLSVSLSLSISLSLSLSLSLPRGAARRQPFHFECPARTLSVSLTHTNTLTHPHTHTHTLSCEEALLVGRHDANRFVVTLPPSP